MTTAEKEEPFNVTVFSFGFKYGVPEDVTTMFDVRFLPNPYWVEGMRHLTGRDSAVADYVIKSASGKEFLEKFIPLFTFLVEKNREAGKAGIRVAIGCTGGHHRSVAIVEKLSSVLDQNGITLKMFHRDLGLE